ncbi:hypothetical protein QTP70_008233 [Hemibagrus guttatus]|uniref:Uncharacterized protein n=1 Tax=Hemibagrus guttatus TaxID=175788 RepID=A0AAE0VAU3_9TELE|nr:hypothetical protein QTP70_008233 [Hemibagrus guttatus]
MVDLTKLYLQVALALDAKPKMAFSTTGTTFQHLMDIVLWPYKTFSAYLNNVIIHSSTWSDHFHLGKYWGPSEGQADSQAQQCHLGLTKAQYL